MRINRFLAQATGVSRRAADTLIAEGRVLVNGYPAPTGHIVAPEDAVTYQGKVYTLAQIQSPDAKMTIMLNKPAGYVVSRDGQGSETIYEILPEEYHHLKPIGRLDKYSSGLLLLTNDGDLAQELTHPKNQKTKVYEVVLSQPLAPLHRQMIQDHGVMLDDGPSKFEMTRIKDGDENSWRITMREGRNRQIRRTFLSLGYGVSKLHRTNFDSYSLAGLLSGKYTAIRP
jgi:23S rRNA pseudouridine2605 synthase